MLLHLRFVAFLGLLASAAKLVACREAGFSRFCAARGLHEAVHASKSPSLGLQEEKEPFCSSALATDGMSLDLLAV